MPAQFFPEGLGGDQGLSGYTLSITLAFLQQGFKRQGLS